jgi:hypothetical protein
MRITYSKSGDARISKDGVTITVKSGANLAPDVLMTAMGTITDALVVTVESEEDIEGGQ